MVTFPSKNEKKKNSDQTGALKKKKIDLGEGKSKYFLYLGSQKLYIYIYVLY